MCIDLPNHEGSLMGRSYTVKIEFLKKDMCPRRAAAGMELVRPRGESPDGRVLVS